MVDCFPVHQSSLWCSNIQRIHQQSLFPNIWSRLLKITCSPCSGHATEVKYNNICLDTAQVLYLVLESGNLSDPLHSIKLLDVWTNKNAKHFLWFQLLRHEDLLLLSVFYLSEFITFDFQIVWSFETNNLKMSPWHVMGIFDTIVLFFFCSFRINLTH